MIRLFFVMSISVILIKVLLLITFSIEGFSLGKGGDADYYHGYAVGRYDYAVKIWPVILRWLNDIGVYSRNKVVILLNILVLLAIPLLVAKLSIRKHSAYKNRIFWYTFFLMCAYPTLNFFALDVYRDVVMIMLLVLGLFFFKYLSYSSNCIGKILVFLVALSWAYILYLFRPYLGAGYAAALIFTVFYSFRRIPLYISIVVLLVALNKLYSLGYLEPLLTYRRLFEKNIGSGSTLGIIFSPDSSFTLNFIKSFIYQMAGVYFVNLASVFVFVVESVPFIAAVIYLVKNKQYADKFVDYLVVFFVVYSSIWLLGNDNLGTAVRLRIYSYIAIAVAFAVVYQNKNSHISRHKQANKIPSKNPNTT